MKSKVKKIIALILVVIVVLSAALPPVHALAFSPKKAIYILPGFMESRLFSQRFHGAEIWVGAGLISEVGLDLVGVQGEFVNNASGAGMTAYADKNRDQLGLLFTFAPMITSLNACLAANGLRNTYNIEFFSYNWIQDINLTAQELAFDINKKGYESVIFITHSNGGILASTYVAQSAENKAKVEKCICLATPFYGVHMSIEAIETGYVNLFAGPPITALLDLGYDLFIRPISKRWVKSWTRNSPNVYQLTAAREYVNRIPILYRTSSGTQAIYDADEYYALLNRSANMNKNLTDGNARSLRYHRETVLNDDIFSVWEGKELILMGNDYGYLTPYTTIYRQVGSKAVYDGTLFGKIGDWIVPSISSKGDGRFPYINLPGAHHMTIFADPRALHIINQIILDKPLPRYTEYESAMNKTSSADPAVGMSDMIRVEIKSSDPLVAAARNSGIEVKIYDSGKNLVARATGETQLGFMENNFTYSSWDSDEYNTNIACYIPASGYTMEISTGNAIRSASDITVRIETLDPSGAFLTENGYWVTGANVLTGAICTIGGGATAAPVAANGVKVAAISEASYRQDWQFESDSISLERGESAVPAITGPDTPYMARANYSWTSSNPNVAYVSGTGLITALSDGTAVITAIAKDASFKMATIDVTVGAGTTPNDESGDGQDDERNDGEEGGQNGEEGGQNGGDDEDEDGTIDNPVDEVDDGTNEEPVDVNAYTVVFDSRGGSNVPAVSAVAGAPAPKPADPVKTGYIFTGWYFGETIYNFNQAVTSDLFLTAGWLQITYQVNFDANGGYPTIAGSTVDYGKTATAPADPARAGYIFAGWYDGASLYDFGKPVYGNLNLKAMWTPKTCTVKFVTGEIINPLPIKVEYGGKAIKPPNPISIRRFDYWALNGVPYDFNEPVTSDLTLTAVWK